MTNYGANSHLKSATVVDTSQFARKIDLASLISDIDKLDIDKLGSFKSTVDELDG